jgi:hypothetical protein
MSSQEADSPSIARPRSQRSRHALFHVLAWRFVDASRTSVSLKRTSLLFHLRRALVCFVHTAHSCVRHRPGGKTPGLKQACDASQVLQMCSIVVMSTL